MRRRGGCPAPYLHCEAGGNLVVFRNPGDQPTPLPTDERVLALANDILQQFDTIFGLHPGFRAAHAKGVMLTGSFTPAPGAERLTKAPHITHAETPVTVRFSNSTGLPQLPDHAPDANPRGLAIRFDLAEHVHTDIVSHSIDAFPTRNGQEFLELLQAAASSGPDVLSPKPIEQFLGAHPAALAFVQAPKPFPESLATQSYFGVTAFSFTNAQGETKFGRYRIVPEGGNRFLSDEQAAKLAPISITKRLWRACRTGRCGFESWCRWPQPAM